MRSTLLCSLACSALLAAACGSDSPGITDASITDTPIVDGEVTEADASSGVVRVTIYDFGNPVPDVPVYFQNADSSLVLAAMTGSDGSAQATMMPGGFVSAFVPPSNQKGAQAGDDVPAAGGFFSREVFTFAGVKPGDELLIGELPRTTFLIDISFPTEPDSTNFDVRTTCGDSFLQLPFPQASGTIMGTIAVEDCTGGLADFALVADGGKGGQRALVARDVAVAEGTGSALAGTWGSMHTNTVTYSGLDDGVFEVGLEQLILTSRGRIGFAFNNGSPTGGTVSLDTDHPVAPGAGIVQANLARFFPSGGFSQSVVAEWGPHAAATTIAPTPVLLHAYTDFPGFDLANRRVAWSEAPAGVTADFAVAYLSIARPSEKRSWDWNIAGPRTEANLALPTLPTDVIDFNPAAGDDVAVDQLYTYQVPGGYDAARARALSDDLDGMVASPTGRIVREEIFFQPL